MKYILLFLLAFSQFSFAFDGGYPKTPDHNLTPGSFCTNPTELRYPERIKYCRRNVSQSDKLDVFDDYRDKLGFTLPGKRADYKIDHFIPLCMGGSNNKKNLWPQHASVYGITDPMEGLGCEKLQLGKIKQVDLVERIKAAKYDHALVPGTLDYLNSL